MTNQLKSINGKHYPVWHGIIANKADWIGGLLYDRDNDPFFGVQTGQTKIKDISLAPNGDDSAFFEIVGEEFNSGFDVHHGGLSCTQPDPNQLHFHGYMSHTFYIEKREIDPT